MKIQINPSRKLKTSLYEEFLSYDSINRRFLEFDDKDYTGQKYDVSLREWLAEPMELNVFFTDRKIYLKIKPIDEVYEIQFLKGLKIICEATNNFSFIN